MLFRTSDGDGVLMHGMARRTFALRLEGRRKVAARNANWWQLARQGWTSADIADVQGVSERTVRHGIAAAEKLRRQLRAGRETEPECLPLFGCEPWVRTLLQSRHGPEVVEDEEAECRICRGSIGPGDEEVCMNCHESGHDEALARELGRAVVSGELRRPAPKSRLRGDAPSARSPAPETILSQKLRAELAETPQGFLWLRSIGQLPSAEAVRRREARKAKAARA